MTTHNTPPSIVSLLTPRISLRNLSRKFWFAPQATDPPQAISRAILRLCDGDMGPRSRTASPDVELPRPAPDR
ncbi:hypothetical protein DL765_009206 [Monosporascus sp. GIB2]|nr:hypothetical protein DL765_009206 [Monosporascus sp. GIB2]